MHCVYCVHMKNRKAPVSVEIASEHIKIFPASHAEIRLLAARVKGGTAAKVVEMLLAYYNQRMEK